MERPRIPPFLLPMSSVNTISGDENSDVTIHNGLVLILESDDEEAAVRRKQPSSAAPSSEQHAAASDPMEQALPVRATATSFAPPPSEDSPGTAPEAPSAPDGGASHAASSASSPAPHKNATDAMELAEETTTVLSPQGPVHPAARFLKDPPRQTALWLKRKGKKKT
nr:uncharacterized protein LOC129386645 [Dermacentor andersoni]